MEDADSPEKWENRIEYWVGTGDLDASDTAALNQDAVEELKQVAKQITAVVDDPEEADETVAFIEDPENADHNVVEPDEPTAEKSSDAVADEDKSPDVGLVESDHEMGLTDTLDRPRIRAPEEKIRTGTSKLDKEIADEFGAGLRDRGATVEDHSITTPLSGYNNQVKESTAIPTMSVLPEAEQVVIGTDDEMILVATDEPSPEVLDHCLETIEDYIETVQNHGHTQSETAVMAQIRGVPLRVLGPVRQPVRQGIIITVTDA